jgi:hypothetical protein
MNEASVKSTCEEAISCTQTHCLRRLNSVDHDEGEGRDVRQYDGQHAYLIHAFEQCRIVRILGK